MAAEENEGCGKNQKKKKLLGAGKRREGGGGGLGIKELSLPLRIKADMLLQPVTSSGGLPTSAKHRG